MEPIVDQYAVLLNLSWIIKCLFLRNMGPLMWNNLHMFVQKILPVILFLRFNNLSGALYMFVFVF